LAAACPALVTFLDLVEIPGLAYHGAEIPDEVIPVENPVVEFPGQVMATSPVRALVVREEILDSAFPAEAFQVRNVAEEVDFGRESRMGEFHMVAFLQELVAVRGGETVEAGR